MTNYLKNIEMKKNIFEQNNPLETNFEDFTMRKLMTGHENFIHRIAICFHRKILVTISGRCTVKLWNLENYNLINTYQYSSGKYDIILSNQGQLAFCDVADYSINLVDLIEDGIVNRLYGHKNLVYRFAFSNDCKYLLSGSADETVRIWDIKSRKELFHIDLDCYIYGFAISGNNNLIATTSKDRIMRIWSFFDQNLLFQQTLKQQGFFVQFLNEKQILASSHGNVIKLWSLLKIHQRKLYFMRQFKSTTGYISTILLSFCSRYIIAINYKDREIRIIYLETGEIKLVQQKKGRKLSIVYAAMSKEMDVLAYAEDNDVVVWRRK